MSALLRALTRALPRHPLRPVSAATTTSAARTISGTSRAEGHVAGLGTTVELNNGVAMPRMGLGTWQAEPGAVGAAVTAALAAGYRHIDCASVYGNEGEVGLALAAAIADGVVTRDDVFVTSKLWCTSHGTDNVAPALERSLERLGLDHLDLYLIHVPVALRKRAPEDGGNEASVEIVHIPLAETWAGMESVLAAGLTRAIGVSNMPTLTLNDLLGSASVIPAVNQIERHPYLPQTEHASWAAEHGIQIIAYSPLGNASLDAHAAPGAPPPLLEHPVVADVAAAVGATRAQVLLAWNLAQGSSVIPKSVSPARIVENAASIDLQLPADALEALNALDCGRRYLDFAWTGFSLFK
ncbi:aldehyde reductase [Thecamonas trahens ATCC 50062]|uniref:Aldehyde reductase n=1 Tax=Thecamonas trahens ATCC 50062 TaxID=461836 RepID=A0A0L0DCN6_THETB|nr:aldehyde reductase [Thecamonas trahens ATCC 50062]KNC49886.1 aldehyde reductase [Thecamonas trahens ATCC 50062]|eukprot:XP_013757368.1 aldehyde reductase [Thecamonas trahens ATCC 50062]